MSEQIVTTVPHASGPSRVVRVSRAELFAGLPAGHVILTDSTVADILGLSDAVVVPAGETSKSLAVYGETLDALARRRASRKTTLVALGGGVVGDLGGFVAATYMRGVPLIQIPTTLLAQVDSSVGGKTGIDLPSGKNLAGAFHPAREVRICHEIMDSLPPRQVVNGLAEVVKYGFIMDPGLLTRVSDGSLPPESVVDACIRHKRNVVAEDEFETTGRRAILNFGHTIGHAIERALGYETLLHGEAIAIGMVKEAALGERIGVSPPGTCDTVRTVIKRVGLPDEMSDEMPDLDPETLLDAMRSDKKATRGRLAFSLLRDIGECSLVPDVEESHVREVLR